MHGVYGRRRGAGRREASGFEVIWDQGVVLKQNLWGETAQSLGHEPMTSRPSSAGFLCRYADMYRENSIPRVHDALEI